MNRELARAALDMLAGRSGKAVTGAGGTRRQIKARLDAAQTTVENRRHWANADYLSADAAYSPEVRRTVRSRARYEYLNNTYALGLVNSIANEAVGTGPRLQVLTKDRRANTRVEERWYEWCSAVGLPDLLRLVLRSDIVDGESFLLFYTREMREPRISLFNRPTIRLGVRAVEADQFASPFGSPAIGQPNNIDGIIIDNHGDPIQYTMLKSHPGDISPLYGMSEARVIPAYQVIHYFRQDRPGQHRGLSHLAPALPLFAMLRRYTLAVLASAELQAERSFIFTTDAAPDYSTGSDSSAFEALDEVPLGRYEGFVAPPGMKPEFMDVTQPSTTYGEFKAQILNEIARCLLAPYNVAAGNSSGYNFASARLDVQSWVKMITVERERIERIILNRIFDEWLLEASLVERYLPSAVRIDPANVARGWTWDGFEHVDPVKNALAMEIALRNNATTLASWCASMGMDWEEVLEHRRVEVQAERELGLPSDILNAQKKKADSRASAGATGVADESEPADEEAVSDD